MSGAERGKYLFRIARGIAERARELAVVETLDNGKPIKETRDFDVPTAAQHFFYHAGWADKLQHLGLGADPRPLGVAGQVIPWNFPLLMAAWKIAPGAGRRQHRGDQAGRDHPAVDPGAGRDHRRRRPAARRGQHRDRAPATSARRWSPTRAWTRWPSPARPPSAARIQRELAGTGRKITLELGGKGANIVFDDAAQDQAIEGIVNGIFFNQGQVCCAGSRLLVQESIAEEFAGPADRPGGDAAGRRPDGQEHRRRRDQLESPARPDHHPDAGRSWPRARPPGPRPARCPGAALLRPDDLHRRDPVDADRPGGDLRTELRKRSRRFQIWASQYQNFLLTVSWRRCPSRSLQGSLRNLDDFDRHVGLPAWQGQ